MSSDDYVNIGALTVKRVSTKAALIIINGEETWIPFSQTHEDSVAEFKQGAKLDRCLVKRWIADEKNLAPPEE